MGIDEVVGRGREEGCLGVAVPLTCIPSVVV